MFFIFKNIPFSLPDMSEDEIMDLAENAIRLFGVHGIEIV